jgi:hypothetical protein
VVETARVARASIDELLGELAALVRNDELRGGAGPELLAVRCHASLQARKASEPYAYRQALLELAACATSLATRLQAPAAPVPRIVSTRSEQPMLPSRAATLTERRSTQRRLAA